METVRWIISIVGLLMLSFFAYVLVKIFKLMLHKHDAQGMFVCGLGALFILGFGFLLVYGLVAQSMAS